MIARLWALRPGSSTSQRLGIEGDRRPRPPGQRASTLPRSYRIPGRRGSAPVRTFESTARTRELTERRPVGRLQDTRNDRPVSLISAPLGTRLSFRVLSATTSPRLCVSVAMLPPADEALLPMIVENSNVALRRELQAAAALLGRVVVEGRVDAAGSKGFTGETARGPPLSPLAFSIHACGR